MSTSDWMECKENFQPTKAGRKSEELKAQTPSSAEAQAIIRCDSAVFMCIYA